MALLAFLLFFIFSFYFNIWFCGSFGLFALFSSESITCQHAPRLSLVFATDDRFDFNGLCDLSTFPLSFGKHSWKMVFLPEYSFPLSFGKHSWKMVFLPEYLFLPYLRGHSLFEGAFQKDGVSLGVFDFFPIWGSIPYLRE